MTYAPLPIHQKTFAGIALAGALSLATGFVLAALHPNGPPAAARTTAAADVSTTGALGPEPRREWVDPPRRTPLVP